MRQIKFRGWSEDHNKFVEVDYIDLLRKGFGIQYRQSLSAVTWEFPDEFILSQFTGLTDKNGKEIYEGDILKYKIQGTLQNDNYVVDTLENLYLDCNHSDPYYRITEMEIIGNVYENPELINTNL